MRRIMKRNQVVITALAVMLAVAGYLTYAGKQDLNTIQDNAAVQMVSADYDTYVAGAVNDELAAAQAAAASSGSTENQNTETGETTAAPNAQADENAEKAGILDIPKEIDSMDYDINDPGEAVLASGMTVKDYMASARLAREQIRGKNREDLLAVISDEESDTINRQAAVDKMVELADNSDKECAAETLLSAKGFENSIVSITDGKVDVVICKNELTDAELAQIEDIVKRKAEVSAAEIVISLLDVGE